MVVAAVAVGGVYPAVVQRFQVQPNQQDAEAEFIERNIDATLDAYDLAGRREDATTTPRSRPRPARCAPTPTPRPRSGCSTRRSSARRSSSSSRSAAFYDFPDSLSVDRYEIDGESRDTVIAVRELVARGPGRAAAQLDQRHHRLHARLRRRRRLRQHDRRPRRARLLGGRHPVQRATWASTSRASTSARRRPLYSIVGAPEGTDPWELDYPDDDSEGAVNSTFPTQDVSAGPSIGNPLNKLLYALKFGSEQILFSDRVTSDSQILYDRDPRDRVQKVAPYLTLDGRVYPAVVDGRVKWIVDGYTTSDQYPYSAPKSLDDATTDSLTESSETIQALQPKTANYIRNSVKATVDAYDGSVTLYAWDAEDPILKAWDSVFPSTLEPLSSDQGQPR